MHAINKLTTFCKRERTIPRIEHMVPAFRRLFSIFPRLIYIQLISSAETFNYDRIACIVTTHSHVFSLIHLICFRS